MTTRAIRHMAVAGLLGAGLAACDETTGPTGTQQVAVAFRSTASTAADVAGTSRSLLARSLEIQGTNGTLVIDELRIIVAEFELDRLNDDDCDDDGTSNDDCEKFEAPPAFVDVALDGGETVAVTAAVAPDTYDELEFEIEDLDDDEEDPVQAQQIADLLADIRAEFPDWPREASMLVRGTFTPTDGAPQAFRVYFEAEVEIEMDLAPPVTITDDGSGATFTVEIDPALWFTRGDGSVWNLAAHDYDATGSVVEFEVEIENGFAEVEVEND